MLRPPRNPRRATPKLRIAAHGSVYIYEPTNGPLSDSSESDSRSFLWRAFHLGRNRPPISIFVHVLREGCLQRRSPQGESLEVRFELRKRF